MRTSSDTYKVNFAVVASKCNERDICRVTRERSKRERVCSVADVCHLCIYGTVRWDSSSTDRHQKSSVPESAQVHHLHWALCQRA